MSLMVNFGDDILIILAKFLFLVEFEHFQISAGIIIDYNLEG